MTLADIHRVGLSLSAVTSEDPLVGAVLDGKYRLLGPLGAGGMGKVYRAEQVALGRQIAVKVLDASDSHRDADPAVERRFFLEASLCAKLSHPNVVVVHDYGRVEVDGIGRYFIAMELLEGITLHRRLAHNAPVFSAVDALNLGIEIARGLRAAHKAGLVHRDLKPGNIMLVPADDGERVKILDFGLVKQVGSELREDITQEGTFLGSPRYMAPEQVSASPVDHRCDLYSLGVILYQCLTGKTPFDGKAPMEVLVQHVSAPVPPMRERNPAVQVPPAMESIVRKLLEKMPSNRFADADALLAALREAQSLVTGDATVASKSSTGQFSQLAAQAAMQQRGPTPSSAPPTTIASGEPSGTIAGTTYSSTEIAPPRNKSKTIAVSVGLLSVFLGVGAVAAWKLSDSRSRTADPSTQSTNNRQNPADQQGTSAPAPTRTSLRIESTPPGARVRESGMVLGVTPLTVALESTGPSRTFEVLQDGFIAYRFTQAPSASPVTVTAELERDPSALAATNSARVSTPPNTGRVRTGRRPNPTTGTGPTVTSPGGEAIRLIR